MGFAFRRQRTKHTLTPECETDMTEAQQQLLETVNEINRIQNNNMQYKDDTGEVWAHLGKLEDDRIALQKMVDEEEREEDFDGGQFGLGA